MDGSIFTRFQNEGSLSCFEEMAGFAAGVLDEADMGFIAPWAYGKMDGTARLQQYLAGRF